MDTLTCSLYCLTTFTSLYPFHFIVSMFSPLSFYLTSRSISFFPTWIGDLFILLHGGLSCHPFTHSIDIYSETFSLRGLCHFIRVVLLYLRAWRYVHLLSYWFVSHCFIQSMRKKTKKTKKKQKQKKNKNKKKQKKQNKTKGRKKKRRKKKREKKNINPCACVYIRYQYQYSFSMYMDL